MAIINREARSAKVEKSITAQNVFSDWLVVRAGEIAAVSISGVFVGTVHVQRSDDGGVTPLDLDSFTGVKEKNYTGPDMLIRSGIKTGNFTSGTAEILIKVSRK